MEFLTLHKIRKSRSEELHAKTGIIVCISKCCWVCASAILGAVDLFDSLAMPGLETGLHSALFLSGGGLGTAQACKKEIIWNRTYPSSSSQKIFKGSKVQRTCFAL